MLKILAFIFLNLSQFCIAAGHFEQGLSQFQKGAYDQARIEFESLLDDPAYRLASLYNLGLTAAKQKKPGLSLAYFKLASKISPRDSDLNYNTQYVLQEYKIQPPSGNISTWDVVRQEILGHFTFLELTMALSLVLIPTLILSYRGLRRSEGHYYQTYFWIFLSVLMGGLVAAKFIDSYMDRAIVIELKAELKSGPSQDLATLTEIQEGSEILLGRDSVSEKNEVWRQVVMPGGLSGWLKAHTFKKIAGDGPW